jgi:carbon storage regulator CsrA
MLCLSRYPRESIVIHRAGEILATVRVLRIEGHRVQLGITAPESVTVDRDEVFAELHSSDRSVLDCPDCELPHSETEGKTDGAA